MKLSLLVLALVVAVLCSGCGVGQSQSPATTDTAMPPPLVVCSGLPHCSGS